MAVPNSIHVRQGREGWAHCSHKPPAIRLRLLWGGPTGVRSREACVHRVPPFIQGSSGLSWRTTQGWVEGLGWGTKPVLSLLTAKAKREMGWIRLVFIFFTERKHIHLSGKTDFFHATRNCVLWILTWRILGNVRHFLTASFLLWFYKRLKKYILLASSFL